MIIIFKGIVPSGFRGITLFPFIFLASRDYVKDTDLINHEKIHLRQQAELLIVLFYIWYGVEFLIRYVYFKNKNLAYRNISFEREAFINEKSSKYLNSYNFFGWIKYL